MNNKSLPSLMKFVKKKRKELNLIQGEFALKTGVGLRFCRELEQGAYT